MNASNDNLHSGTPGGSGEDRRKRFRIDDTAILEVSAIEVTDINGKLAESFFKPSAPFSLMREIRAIDLDSIAAQRAIGEQNSELALLLVAMNKKIEAIGSAVAEAILTEDQQLQTIDLSEGGIGFAHKVKLKEDAYYAIKIWFHRALIGFSAYIRVVASSRSIDGGHHISASFHAMPETDSQIIARHIMQVQAEQQRLKKAETE